MDYLIVVAGFPLLLVLLALGAGLLIERCAGVRLPAALLPALGFGALVVVSQFTTWFSSLAPATPWVLLALAGTGFVLTGRRALLARWGARRRGWWLAPAAGLATYVTVSAPILAAARLTSPGYLLDTTAAVQLAGAERLLHHGRDFTHGSPGYGATLIGYFGHGYPSGGHTVLASVGWLSGQDLFWLFAPFQAVELALSALVLSFLASRAGLSRPAAALTGWIAAVPALVYSYALMGSIKELTVLPLLLTMGALLVLASSMARAGARGTVPFAVTAAAALGAIGIAALGWVAPFALATLAFAAPVLARERRRRPLRARPTARPARRQAVLSGWKASVAGWTASLAAATVVLGLPTLGPLSSTASLADRIQGSNAAAAADPGNLLRPLRFVQSFGVWLGESHRVDPKYLNQTYLLIGVVAICALRGLVWLGRRRAWSLLTFVGLSAVVFAVLTKRGTEWTDAKVLMLLSPVVMLIALIGAFSAMRRTRVEGTLLSAVIVLAVLASDALTYHATGLAPTQRYVELRSIGQRFAGSGPTLATDFDEYALYMLRNSEPDEPGSAFRGSVMVANRVPLLYGHSYDVDELSQRTVQRFRLIVMRRSPTWSRPPGNYALVWSGRSYEVWRRTGPAPRIHIALGAGLQPSATPPCRRIRAVALVAARDHAQLMAAVRSVNVVVDVGTIAHSSNAVLLSDLEGRPLLTFVGPARAHAGFHIDAPGRYQLWLGGNVDRPLELLIDGRRVGAPSEDLGGDANKIAAAEVSLSRGQHDLEIIRPGGGLQPGDNASTQIDAVLFEPLEAERERVLSVAAGAWRSLCGRPLEWIEVA